MFFENSCNNGDNLNRLAQPHLIRQNSAGLLKPLEIKPTFIRKSVTEGELLHPFELVVKHVPTFDPRRLIFLFHSLPKLGLNHVFGFTQVRIRDLFPSIIRTVYPLTSDMFVICSFKISPPRRIFLRRRFPRRYRQSISPPSLRNTFFILEFLPFTKRESHFRHS